MAFDGAHPVLVEQPVDFGEFCGHQRKDCIEVGQAQTEVHPRRRTSRRREVVATAGGGLEVTTRRTHGLGKCHCAKLFLGRARPLHDASNCDCPTLKTPPHPDIPNSFPTHKTRRNVAYQGGEREGIISV